MQINAFYRKAIEAYHATLQELCSKGGVNELHLKPAFQHLLATAGKKAGWTLIPEQCLPNGKVPDGTLRDDFLLPRGYWEAKDTADDLNTEIKKKIDLGYPLTNIIFEDTQRAVLYQDKQRMMEVDLSDMQQVADLLNTFTSHEQKNIEDFEEAVAEFKERIPELAQSVLAIIANERKSNKQFISAFAAFHELCRTSLDPRITSEQIDEMLVQHLLTERLFRTVFDNPDFTSRNAIAQEIEKVIAALTSKSFSRSAFLKTLDPFYGAIEDTARWLQDFSEKQHFLNIVYERFFQGFSVKQADTMGIVYTPQEIVDFMCASVEEVLQREFGKSLSTPGVKILDPCVGTGNFIVNILRRINRRDLKKRYAEDLFCNEIMLLPYYIASMNIEHEFFQLTGEYSHFEGICFADTLDLAEAGQKKFSLFSEANSARVNREKEADITVIIGNPPYNVGQQNESDNNKNRQYPVIDSKIKSTYAKDSNATSNNKLYDPYVKFFRWATDRLQNRDGIVCFVTNNSFVDKIAFDGMRKHIMQDFTTIYHIDLHGDVRKNSKISGSTHNVFGIKVGVGITVAIRNQSNKEHSLLYHKVPDFWTRYEKFTFLNTIHSINSIDWMNLIPDLKYSWLTEGLQSEYKSFIPIGTKSAKRIKGVNNIIFKSYSLGVATNRDEYVYSFDRITLKAKSICSIDIYNSAVDKRKRLSASEDPLSIIENSDNRIKWTRQVKYLLCQGRYSSFSENYIRTSLYRPFAKKFIYFDNFWNEERYQQPRYFPSEEFTDNLAIISGGYGRKRFSVLITNCIPNNNFFADPAQCFPFYIYNEDGTNRRENITDWAVAQFHEKYGEGVTKWDIFYYVYALLHHPVYRERYGENLKHELPHIPLTVAMSDFPAYVAIGRHLADLHLNYETVDEYPLTWIENQKIPFSWRVEKMKLGKDKSTLVVNESLTLTGLPPECFEYHLGNRSALEWVIDQYQVSTDKRSGITSDPNRDDDPEYIIRLIGRVVTVSVETVKLIQSLPDLGITNV